MLVFNNLYRPNTDPPPMVATCFCAISILAGEASAGNVIRFVMSESEFARGQTVYIAERRYKHLIKQYTLYSIFR